MADFQAQRERPTAEALQETLNVAARSWGEDGLDIMSGEFAWLANNIERLMADRERVDSLTRILFSYAPLADRLKQIAGIIEHVDQRCMACDGPVTPTLQEMTQEEISNIYALASTPAAGGGTEVER